MKLNLKLKELEEKKECFFLLTLKNIKKGKRKLVKSSVIIKRLKKRYNVNYIIVTLHHHDFFGYYYQIVVSGMLNNKELNVIEESIRLLFKEFKEEEIRLDVRLDKVAPLLDCALEDRIGENVTYGVDLFEKGKELLKGYLRIDDAFFKLEVKKYWGDVLRDPEFKDLVKYNYTELRIAHMSAKSFCPNEDFWS